MLCVSRVIRFLSLSVMKYVVTRNVGSVGLVPSAHLSFQLFRDVACITYGIWRGMEDELVFCVPFVPSMLADDIICGDRLCVMLQLVNC